MIRHRARSYPFVFILLVLFLLELQPSHAMRPLVSRSLALQSDTVIPLMLDEVVEGELDGEGASITYRFTVPQDQDVVVAYDADHVILSSYCLEIIGVADDPYTECLNNGGGGDGPISITYPLLATHQAETEQTVELTLKRTIDGLARYELGVYTVSTHEDIEERQPVDVTLEEDGQAYQLFMFKDDYGFPFSVQIQDEEAEGDFLWVAYQPYLDVVFGTLPTEPTHFLTYVDGSSRENNVDGIDRLQLYQDEGNQFVILVESTGPYSLYTQKFDFLIPDEGESLRVTTSFEAPLQVVLIDLEAGDEIQIDAQVTQGSGAVLNVYGGTPILSYVVLSMETALSKTTSYTAIDDVSSLIVVQIPFEYTRGEVVTEITWTRQ